MAVYAVGDVQGCLRPLRALLSKIGYNHQHDQLWLVGDLVNRGPESLETLNFIRALGAGVHCVLGNHDFHLIKTYLGLSPPPSDGSFDSFLASRERHGLIDWLRKRPLFYHDRTIGAAMVHAGLLADWSFEEAENLSGEVELRLQADDYQDFLAELYGNQPDRWRSDLQGIERMRMITNVMTRMRFQAEDGRLDFIYKREIGSQGAGLKPWFEYPHCRGSEELLVVGHWSALGFMHRFGVLALDTGCVWQGRLTAVRLDNQEKSRSASRVKPKGPKNIPSRNL